MHLSTLFFPRAHYVRVHDIVDDGHRLILFASTRHTARCPRCRHRSTRFHSHYERQAIDLPCQGRPVVLRLHVRRFRCWYARCPVRIFTERLPRVLAPRARRTCRAQEQLRLQGLVVGGRPGARHARQLGHVVSARTILRLVHSMPVEPAGPVRVLGVDDFAFRRGHRYGTVLVNLETHRVIDLLPDREAQTLATWLRDHPEVEVVSRDRAGAYAEGARSGAPQAQQVSDRWHLLHSLSEAVQRHLRRHHRQLEQAHAALRAATGVQELGGSADAAPPLSAAEPPHALTRTGPEQQITRDRRQARNEAILALHRQAVPIAAIARQLGLTRPTVRRVVQAGEGVPAPQAGWSGILRAFESYLWARWQQGCTNARCLWQEIAAQGYTGSYAHLRLALRCWRTRPAARGRHAANGPRPESEALPAPVRTYSPRQTARLLTADAATLDPDERLFLAQLLASAPSLAEVRRQVQTFGALLRTGTSAALAPWLTDVEAHGTAELQSFARGIRRDQDAVDAALRLPWSNGPVEGAVNRIKVIKRQMFGRASFGLLRTRVLHRV